MLFDTHCHIYDEQYALDQEKVINDALERNVKLLLVPGDNLEHSKKAIELSEKYSFIYAAIGVHPSDVYDLEIEETINTLKELSLNSKVKAIGEIGLDYYWYKEEEQKNKQKEFFIAQIKLANELKLPVIIHSRDAYLDTINIIKEYKPLYGFVFHCFSYSLECLKEVLALGGYIGLDGPVTYKNALTPKEVAKHVNLDRLFLETDSPYLSPTPKRGTRNEPSNLTYIASEIAQLKGITYDELTRITYENGMRFFKI